MEIQEPPEEPLFFSPLAYCKKRLFRLFTFFQIRFVQPQSVRAKLVQTKSVQKLNIIFLILILTFFVSCSKEENNESVDLNSSVLKEAKYSDIPIPVGHSFVSSNNKKNNLLKDNSDHLFFVGNNSLQENLDFYLNNMEVLGWDIDNFSVDEEVLLVCNKTSRSCVISIRNIDVKKNKTNVSIFIRKNMNGGEENSSDHFSLQGEKNFLEQMDKIKDINSKVLIEHII